MFKFVRICRCAVSVYLRSLSSWGGRPRLPGNIRAYPAAPLLHVLYPVVRTSVTPSVRYPSSQPVSFIQHHVPSAVYRNVFDRLRDNFQSRFGRVQGPDKERHRLPSSGQPVAVL